MCTLFRSSLNENKDREHFVLLDLAYQGFATGDPERDATALVFFFFFFFVTPVVAR
jgi:aspartate/tyrosine/aromatic aminotransferase